mmetsp:Transcript_102390/g.330257  ORF Transcript_102390/g.330257 Transcript_102390/m.330257 type:complete len:223 (+) Transcript_102390:388-1056(+)
MLNGMKFAFSTPRPPQRGSTCTSGILAACWLRATQAATDLSGSKESRRISSWVELHISPASSSTIQSVARSLLMEARPSSMMVIIIVSNSLALFARSEACRSTRRRLHMPSEQPRITPQMPPAAETRFVRPNRSCASVSPGSGRPIFRQMASMVLPKVTPQVSLSTWPIAAAASVGSPRKTPTVLSIASPAQMSTVWSTKPKATKGSAELKKSRRSCRVVGR